MLRLFFKSNLNDEIAAINIEKGAFIGDALFLEDIPTEKYIFESLDSRILNYKGYFVMYGIVDTPIRDIQEDNFVEDLTMTFQVATFDKGEADRKNTFYKLLRYRRAIKTVLKKILMYFGITQNLRWRALSRMRSPIVIKE